MTTGARVSSACLRAYHDLRDGKKHKYVLFNLGKDNTEIVVEKVSSSTDYEDFIADLPETECRWAVYDFEFEKEGAGKRKLAFVWWAPHAAQASQKMFFGASNNGLVRSLAGVAFEIQGAEYSEVAYEAVLDKANSGN
ncbi:actin-binding ADF family protein [Streptomyces rhizosphaerihabitans]|uniref:actin-binding ADF family protein n=1 Tax=Streptomyces rhizosphaerihabitans TaxID=1266770 RepID=UPI0021BE958E|nr:actin depolymerization factor/cofilin-like domain-containing protein [Streptomyces rhizosphaerihabitans]MCT9004639.1 actin depolymerization factor/cofilin-like domain-containing protein [Streptomyces rhizosphaerihabitans]